MKELFFNLKVGNVFSVVGLGDRYEDVFMKIDPKSNDKDGKNYNAVCISTSTNPYCLGETMLIDDSMEVKKLSWKLSVI